jgi:iron complex outermembrane receptor protein
MPGLVLSVMMLRKYYRGKGNAMRNFNYSAIACACALLLQTCIANASEEDDLVAIYGDKANISIATGSQQSVRRAPAVATVITAEDIAMMGANDLDQVLETVPGLHVSKIGPSWEPTYIFRGILLGANNAQVLMLQNGVPMTIMFTGSRGVGWGGLPVAQIARIEIIRGPGSALYGADAFSGVINIITKGASDVSGTQLAVGAGSFKTHDLWVQHGGKIGPVSVAAYLRVGHTDGEKEVVTADAQTARDKAFGTNVSRAPGPLNTDYDSVTANLDLVMDKWHMRAGYKGIYNLGTGVGISQALDPIGKYDSIRTNADLSWTDSQFAKNWGVGFVGSYLGYQQRVGTHYFLSPPGTKFPTGSFPEGMRGHPDFSERDLRLSGYAIYSGFEGHNLRFGLGHDDLNIYKTRTIKNFLPAANGTPIPQPEIADYSVISPFMLPHRRKVDYVYTQDVYQLHRDWSLTAGIRHDKFSDVGATTNPRLALVWDASLNVTAKLLYGQAFRAPSFNELYGENNPTQKGNPMLRPETVKTMELAVSWENTAKNMQINVNIYRLKMNDIIGLKPNEVIGTGSTFANFGKQDGRGMELEVVYDSSRALRFSGNYAYQHTVDLKNGVDAGNTPHHHLFAKAEWRFADGWMLSPQFDVVAGRKRPFGDTRPDTPDYKTFDLSLKTTKFNNFDISATVRNMFNADVREPGSTLIPNDLPMPKRSFYLQASYKL